MAQVIHLSVSASPELSGRHFWLFMWVLGIEPRQYCLLLSHLRSLGHFAVILFYEWKFWISALPLSELCGSISKSEPCWWQEGKQCLWTWAEVERGPWSPLGSGWLVSGHPVLLCTEPVWLSLKTVWVLPQMKSQLESSAVFLTLTRSVIKCD